MDQIISFLTLLLLALLGLVIDVIGFVDGLFASALSSIGVPPAAQPPLLIIAAILLAIGAFQLLGRFAAALLIILFLLLLIHPHLPHEWRHNPAPPFGLHMPRPNM